jgi:hypothetical protein
MCARFMVNCFLSYPLNFSHNKEVKWDEKIFYLEKENEGVNIGVWGM